MWVGFHQQLDTLRVACATYYYSRALLYQRTYATRFVDLSRIFFSAPYTRAYNIESQSLSNAVDAEWHASAQQFPSLLRLRVCECAVRLFFTKFNFPHNNIGCVCVCVLYSLSLFVHTMGFDIYFVTQRNRDNISI